MVVYVIAVLGVVMVRDKGLERRFETRAGHRRARAQEPRAAARGAPRAGRRAAGQAPAARQPRAPREGPPAHRLRGAPRAASTSSATPTARAPSWSSGSAWRSSCSSPGASSRRPRSSSSGVFAFDAWLHGTARRRQEQIERGLPDFLDILAVCVSAGIAFRPALARVAESSEGPVREEMLLVAAPDRARRAAARRLRGAAPAQHQRRREHLRHRRPAGRGARRAADRRARRPGARHAPGGLPARAPARAEGRAARVRRHHRGDRAGRRDHHHREPLRQRGSQSPGWRCRTARQIASCASLVPAGAPVPAHRAQRHDLRAPGGPATRCPASSPGSSSPPSPRSCRCATGTGWAGPAEHAAGVPRPPTWCST